MKDFFRLFATQTATIVGSPWAFVTAVMLVLAWSFSGPYFGYSDTWQLVINTSTTIITFLMVFIIQNSQNRDGKALQLKLDELIKVNKMARNKMVDLENLSEEEIKVVEEEFKKLRGEQ